MNISTFYNQKIHHLNPPLVIGPAIEFKDAFQQILDLIKNSNPEAKILISAIIPRKWDHDRRRLQWLDEGERPTLYFCNLEKKNYVEKNNEKNPDEKW